MLLSFMPPYLCTVIQKHAAIYMTGKAFFLIIPAVAGLWSTPVAVCLSVYFNNRYSIYRNITIYNFRNNGKYSSSQG